MLIIDILLVLHFLGLAMGIGGGIAMGQVGPRLAAAAPDQRGVYWPLANAFSRIADSGLVLLLVTGPLLLWLKYSWGAGLGLAFMIKMALVLLIICTIGLAHVGLARLKRGDESGSKLSNIAGPLSGLTSLGIVLAAVFAFH